MSSSAGPVFKTDPQNNLLDSLEKRAWRIFWAHHNAKKAVSYEHCAIEALKGDKKLGILCDASARVSVQNIVERMKAKSKKSRQIKRDIKKSEEFQACLPGFEYKKLQKSDQRPHFSLTPDQVSFCDLTENRTPI